jgi:hypothetical protein
VVEKQNTAHPLYLLLLIMRIGHLRPVHRCKHARVIYLPRLEWFLADRSRMVLALQENFHSPFLGDWGGPHRLDKELQSLDREAS